MRRLVHRIAEHDSLIARALVLVAAGINAHGDVGRLRMQVALHLHIRPVKSLLLVADVLHAFPRYLLDALKHRAGAADFAANHHPVGGGKRLAGHPAYGVLRQKGVKHSIRNPVAELVGMALRNRFGGEDVVFAGHERSIG